MQAPEVIQADDAYFLYYSVSEFESQDSAIGVARSDTMDDGTWEDLGSTGVDSTEGSPYNAIDPSLINVDGTWYMTFGSFWENFFQVPMDGPEKSTGTPAQIAFDPVTTALEGVAMLKNGDFYYLFYSKGSCCKYDAEMPAAGEEYKIMVCRSESAMGGFVDQDGTACTEGGGTVVLESHGVVYGPGGQGVYDDPTHGPVSISLCDIAYLANFELPRSYITTTSTPILGMAMATSSLGGIPWTFRPGGRWFRVLAARQSHVFGMGLQR
ncbi:family 43 glycosylhydrolase [Candidatus Bathyarchaeota archaeon]|nr:family 43 glycosylhydrolase [Candidatus Bathyarchaeota archaeon]